MENKKRKIAVLFGAGVLLIWSLLRMGQAAITGPIRTLKDYTVPENSAIGTNVGVPLTMGTDMEGAILRYFIEMDRVKGAPTDDHDFFSIDPETAQLKTKAVFDYETVTYESSSGRFELELKVTEYRNQEDYLNQV
ncbi:MAG: cadherin repeat domain-containing protein, partial [Candidatus Poribacteria bacterium]|nr:cadherin repeat domain-containing protein [Candidatus Poribacteria bacterium]